jgi:hypothetical protein
MRGRKAGKATRLYLANRSMTRLGRRVLQNELLRELARSKGGKSNAKTH